MTYCKREGLLVAAAAGLWAAWKAYQAHAARDELRTSVPNLGSVVSITDVSTTQLRALFEVATRCREIVISRGSCEALKDKLVGVLFFEPSTRTRCSFEAAARRLGAGVVALPDASSSSTAKGESLEDTVKMMSLYADALVMRHSKEGAAAIARVAADPKPVINAGDGAGEHPTQALLDLYTIWQLHPTVIDDPRVAATEPLHVAFVGDMKFGRTVHSLAVLLARFNTVMSFVGEEGLELPKAVAEAIQSVYEMNGLESPAKRVHYPSLSEAVTTSDILYMTRVQSERLGEVERSQKRLHIDAQTLRNARASLRIMHPFPRVDEISTEVDATDHALYFTQAENGLYVRMALLLAVLKPGVPV